MEGLEDKLGAILGNPEMMQQIMSMAQALGSQQQLSSPAAEPGPPEGIDPAMIQKLLGLVNQSGISRDQTALLQALRPFLREEKLRKLERAMRSAKIAGLASSALGSGMLSQLLGG